MEIKHNFLLKQYEETSKPNINHNYLKEQFADYQEIFKEIEKLVQSCDYTLGKAVNEFEEKICALTGAKYAIGVGSGTDAIFLSLKALGIKEGDEVITTPYTFFATIGAIVTAGAKPVFVDIKDDYNLNPELIEAAITEKTKAIVPVHWAGLCCEMDRIKEIAGKHNLKIVEDACHAINAKYYNQVPGTFGAAGCFSMHPLKNINVWGDGGFIITNSKEMHDQLVLLRNHGLINRDECAVWAYNSRLDSLQAIVGNHLLKKVDLITNQRIENAAFFDQGLSQIPQITIPRRDPEIKQVFHIYVIRAERRNELQKFLVKNGVDAKVHYPIPMHLQPAAEKWGYKNGDFPNAEKICDSVLSLPVHEFITPEQREYIIKKIKEFYTKMESTKVKFVNLGLQYQNLREEILTKFDELSKQGLYILTDELKIMEKNFAGYCETKYALGVGNGTDAIILCLKALGIGEGDEVITAPNSFIATAGAIAMAGAEPVFVDVGSDLNLNSKLLEQAITEKTKAIIPVHLTGRPAEMDKINEIAGKYGLKIIEDAAQAIGARYKGKKVGSWGDAGCFSLHPLKNLHLQGDAGFITTSDPVLYEKLLQLRNHGLKNRNECDFWGYNSRLDSIQAGIGNIKLKYIDQWNKRHREIAAMYREGLKYIVEVPKDKDYEEPVYHNFVIQSKERDELKQFLLEKGIETAIHYPIPIHLQKAAAVLGYREGDFPLCETQAKKILSLPIYPELTNEEIAKVIEGIKSFYPASQEEKKEEEQRREGREDNYT